MIKVILVEDNEVVRSITVDMIMNHPNLEIAGVAKNGLEALKLLDNGLTADIVLADLNMEGMNGIELSKNITANYDNLNVVILTMHENPAYLERALASGAKGYLLKNGDMEEVFNSIKKVMTGKIVIGI